MDVGALFRHQCHTSIHIVQTWILYVYSYYINTNVMCMTLMFKQYVAFMFKQYKLIIKKYLYHYYYQIVAQEVCDAIFSPQPNLPFSTMHHLKIVHNGLVVVFSFHPSGQLDINNKNNCKCIFYCTIHSMSNHEKLGLKLAKDY